MKVMKWSVIALAVSAGTSQMALASQQSESIGIRRRCEPRSVAAQHLLQP